MDIAAKKEEIPLAFELKVDVENQCVEFKVCLDFVMIGKAKFLLFAFLDSRNVV